MYRLVWTNARAAPQPDLLHRARLRQLGRREPRPTGSSSWSPQSVGNFWTLQHAQLYTEPERLAKAGLPDRAARARRAPAQALRDHRQRAARRSSEWRAEPTDAIFELRAPALLKLFFGADPAVLAPLQIEAHRRKLAEYEQIRDDDARRRCPPARGWRSTPASTPSATRSPGGRRLWSRQMATAAEPRPAELPLPGGREGARVKLHPLLTGQMIGPEAWFLREEGRLAWRRALRTRRQEGGLARRSRCRPSSSSTPAPGRS